jgi:hypothetical protein
MLNKPHICIIFLILPLSSAPVILVNAQNIEQMTEEKPVRFTGGLSVQALGYTTTRERPGRDPFVWTISGSPTLSIYGFHIPFSFLFSQKQRTFRQPFNQFGMSPYYKWLKFHVGYRNITFSRYTLAGHQFLGAGLEATPGNFRLGFIYGRFLKAVEDDSLNVEYVIPAYRRKGYAVKLGYGTPSNYVDFILFKAKDDTGSIQRPDLSQGVLPGENLVLGVRTYQRFLKRFTLDLDFGHSTYTRNLYASDAGITNIPFQSIVTGLTTINNSTNVSWAGNASLSFNHRLFGIRLIYNRIESEYQSMGAYFFMNDLEKITIDPSLYLFKRKLNLRASLGYQRNNLSEEKMENTFRRINSFYLNFNPVQKIGINFSYMNYQINQRRNPLIIKDFVDSLQMKQVSNSLSLNVNFTLGTTDISHRFSAGAHYQAFTDENQNTEIFNASKSISPFFNYRFNHKAAMFAVYGRINFNSYSTSTLDQDRLGFTLGASKRLAENKFNLNVSGTHYSNRIDKESDGGTIMLRARINYRFAKKQNLNFSLNFINRNFKQDEKNNFNELLVRFGYSLRI